MPTLSFSEFSAAELLLLRQGMQLLQQCEEIAAIGAQIFEKQEKEPGKILQVLRELWMPRLEALKPCGDDGRVDSSEQFLLVPGGWNGSDQGSSTVMHIVERTGPDEDSFVTCNTGPGLEYHPSDASCPPKLRYKTCIRLDNIPRERMEDAGFWTMMFTLWMRAPPSPMHRVEMLYDVLLPWLAGATLPAQLARTAEDKCSAWRTPQRSGTSAWRAVAESLRYAL